MPDFNTGRDISSGQFKPRGPSGGSLLSLMVGPKSTEEGFIWDILGRVAPGASGILQQVMRYGQATERSIPRGDSDGSSEADAGTIPGLE